MSSSGTEEQVHESPPIFYGLECYIQLQDDKEATRIAALFEQHAGTVVTLKGRRSTTHAIADVWDPELQDHETLVQVVSNWVYDSIAANELRDEDEDLYTPPPKPQSKKRKASSPPLLQVAPLLKATKKASSPRLLQVAPLLKATKTTRWKLKEKRNRR